MTQVEQLWAALSRQHDRPVFRRIDDVHPLDLYAGLDVRDDRVLMLVSDGEPATPPDFESLEVSKTIRSDGRWVLVMRVKRADLSGPFSILCSDIVESTASILPADGPAAVLARVYRWKKLLQPDSTGMTDSEARGLIAELLLLQNFVIPRFGAAPGVRGWTGPSDAPQDFRLPGMTIEVKSCQTGSNRVAISSLDQLDVAGNSLFLVVIGLAESVETDTQAVSLVGLVERVRADVGADADALNQLDLLLTQAGFAEKDKAAMRFYRPDRSVAFKVCERFPRLTRSSAPLGVMDATYVLDLGLCSEFKSTLE